MSLPSARRIALDTPTIHLTLSKQDRYEERHSGKTKVRIFYRRSIQQAVNDMDENISNDQHWKHDTWLEFLFIEVEQRAADKNTNDHEKVID